MYIKKYDDDVHTVYGTNEEFNTLFYDIEQNLDDEASEEQVPDQASISKSLISTFVCKQQNAQSVCLAQVNGKVKRMWVKALFKSDPKINPNFALDMPTYKKTTDIHSFLSKQLYTQLTFILIQIHVQTLNSNYILMEQ